MDIFKERHFDIIYHEAAQTMVPASIDNPYLDADINISGMLRVLEAARKTDVQKLSSLPPPRFMEIIPPSLLQKI